MSQMPPPPAGGSPGPAVGGDRTLMIALAYLWILALIPLLTKKEDKEVQWHSKNGLAILIAEVAFWLLTWIVSIMMPSGSMMGCGVMTTIQCAVWIAFLVVRIVCIVKGVNGQRFRVPVISDFADKF